MTTFVDIVRARTEARPDACAFAFVAAEGDETRLTYAQLELRARAMAALLQDAGAAGERVLILLPPGPDYVIAIFACLLAGTSMVPCAPPGRSGRARQIAAVAADCDAKFAIGSAEFMRDPDSPPLTWIEPHTATDEAASSWRDPLSMPDDVALLQYTSGSTAAPRGVAVTHANLLLNARFIQDGFRHPKDTWGVTWLPPWHDMGLIGGILQSVYFDASSAVLMPMDFIRRPILWLDAISKFRAHTSGGPNFAYELCARSIAPEQAASLKLDCWQVAYIGAEPIRAATLDQFAGKFACAGFRREFFFPCYDLAESTLYVSGGGHRVAAVSADALREKRVVRASENDPNARSIVSCGRPASDLTVAVLDPETHLPCGPGAIGEIHISGPTVAAGYWNRPEETERTFRVRVPGEDGRHFLGTGDLGFLDDGELFVTGRLKDVMIIHGRNHHPEDIEHSVTEASPHIRSGSCAVFSVDSGNEEKVVLVLELPRPQPENPADLAGDIRQIVAASHALNLSKIVLVRPGAIPRTSSGKIRRGECKALYLASALKGTEY